MTEAKGLLAMVSKKVFCVSLFIAAGYVVLTGCSSPEVPTATAIPTESPTSTEPAISAPGLIPDPISIPESFGGGSLSFERVAYGDIVGDGDMAITAVSMNTETADDIVSEAGIVPVATDQWAIATIKIKNRGTGVITPSEIASRLKVYGSDKTSYSSAGSVGLENQIVDQIDIKRNETIEGIVVFNVPANVNQAHNLAYSRQSLPIVSIWSEDQNGPLPF